MSTFNCLHVYVSLLFERLVEIKIKIYSRHLCIDIYDDNCRYIFRMKIE